MGRRRSEWPRVGGRHDVLVVRCASSFPQYLLRVPAPSLSVPSPCYECCACCSALACALHEFYGLVMTYNILTLTSLHLRILL